jgi:tRNA threonylcarbamoyladenosine biosynthesis protein TsaE
MNDAPESYFLADSGETERFGAVLAGCCEPGSVLYLLGELGAGKTTLVRGFLHALGHTGAVKSPTYTLVEPYELGERRVYHFDLYRLGDPGELEYLGIRDYFDGRSIALVEWPQQGAGALPPALLTVQLGYQEGGRRVTLTGDTTHAYTLRRCVDTHFNRR